MHTYDYVLGIKFAGVELMGQAHILSLHPISKAGSLKRIFFPPLCFPSEAFGCSKALLSFSL